MKFVGVDLTSAFSAKPRAIDVAILSPAETNRKLTATFHQIIWPAAAIVTARDTAVLGAMLFGVLEVGDEAVFAIDGPQGLAASGIGRLSERRLGTPGRTNSVLPATNDRGPFQAYIRSSVDLFNAVVPTSLSLAGLDGSTIANATLFEVFPGAEWTVFAGKRLARKASLLGRTQRTALFKGVLNLPPSKSVPTPDQLDALVGAYLAWCTRNRPSAVELIGAVPTLQQNELREGYILHSTQRPSINGELP